MTILREFGKTLSFSIYNIQAASNRLPILGRKRVSSPDSVLNKLIEFSHGYPHPSTMFKFNLCTSILHVLHACARNFKFYIASSIIEHGFIHTKALWQQVCKKNPMDHNEVNRLVGERSFRNYIRTMY